MCVDTWNKSWTIHNTASYFTCFKSCLKTTIDESYNGGAQLRDTTPQATSTSTQCATADRAAVVSTVA